jgi:thiol-disulfide isomerase/thioredoxin
MKKLLRHAAVALAASAAVWSCKPAAPVGASGDALVLEGKTLDGKTLSLASYKGKVVLVDFWATWCDPCRAEIPDLVKLQDKLGPKGFQILGVSMDEDTGVVAPFAKDFKINYPVMLNGSERAPKGWVVPGLPTAYLIGKDGKPFARLFGSKSVEKLAVEIEAALAK